MARATTDPNLSPHTGFGDDINTAIKFRILRGRAGAATDWTGADARVNTFTIRHSNDVVRQLDGRNERELTVRLWFEAVADLEALDAVVGQWATLRYRWGITTTAGGTHQVIAGVAYLVLPGTLLDRLTDQEIRVDGSAEATATFRRAVGAASVAGFAQAIETGE